MIVYAYNMASVSQNTFFDVILYILKAVYQFSDIGIKLHPTGTVVSFPFETL